MKLWRLWSFIIFHVLCTDQYKIIHPFLKESNNNFNFYCQTAAKLFCPFSVYSLCLPCRAIFNLNVTILKGKLLDLRMLTYMVKKELKLYQLHPLSPGILI